MYRIAVVMALALLLIVRGNVLSATPVGMDHKGTEARVLWLENSAIDLARLDLGRVRPRSGSAWVVATIQPASSSGAAFAVGSHIDARTGMIVSSPGAHFVERLSGLLSVDGVISGTAAGIPRSYFWETPCALIRAYFRPPPLPRDDYSPYGGSPDPAWRRNTALCRINVGETGAARFRPTCLIPVDWEQFVAPAVAYVRDHRAMFDAHSVKKNVPGLLKLVGDANPLTAINAFRFLEACRAMPYPSARDALARARGVEQAAFALLMFGEHPGADCRVTDDMQAVVRQAKSPQEVIGLAAVLGLACQRTSSIPDELGPTRIMDVLQTSARGWPASEPDTPELETILNQLGFGTAPGHDTGPAELTRLEQFVKATTPMVVSTGNQR